MEELMKQKLFNIISFTTSPNYSDEVLTLQQQIFTHQYSYSEQEAYWLL